MRDDEEGINARRGNEEITDKTNENMKKKK